MLMEQHESYDPNWTGTKTFSESFVLIAIKSAITITENKLRNNQNNESTNT
jgi:hypothetical protein